MDNFNLYNDIKARTGGEIYLGIVGPVRTGKSTFIRRFMDIMVIPAINDVNEKKAFLDYVSDFEYVKLGIQEPDIVIFLTAPFEMIAKMRESRINNEGLQNDLHERDINYLKEVYDNAMFVANHLSWNIVNCNDGDKLRSSISIK